MNTDFSRINGQSNCVKDFVHVLTWCHVEIFLSNEFSFTRFCDNSNSFIDHFVISCDFASMNLCKNQRVFDDNALGEVNLSDHCAIAITLKPPVFLQRV